MKQGEPRAVAVDDQVISVHFVVLESVSEPLHKQPCVVQANHQVVVALYDDAGNCEFGGVLVGHAPDGV
ncbi:MAG: hypothetical protein R2873_08815 [Caldilineaceae bacterium]